MLYTGGMNDVARANRYAAARAIIGLSQRQLAKRLGVSPQAVSKWEGGIGEASRANARKLADLANITLEWLLTGREAQQETATNVQEFLQARGRKVPEVGNTESGVAPMARNKPKKFVQTYFPCSAQSFALEVSGESMAPDFKEGDVVIIDPTIKPEPGDFVFVELNGGETCLFRRFRPKSVRKGMLESFTLVPCNQDWPNVTVTPEDRAVIRGVMSEKVTPRRKARS